MRCSHHFHTGITGRRVRILEIRGATNGKHARDATQWTERAQRPQKTNKQKRTGVRLGRRDNQPRRSARFRRAAVSPSVTPAITYPRGPALAVCSQYPLSERLVPHRSRQGRVRAYLVARSRAVQSARAVDRRAVRDEPLERRQLRGGRAASQLAELGMGAVRLDVLRCGRSRYVRAGCVCMLFVCVCVCVCVYV
jgi:hypothetical protein